MYCLLQTDRQTDSVCLLRTHALVSSHTRRKASGRSQALGFIRTYLQGHSERLRLESLQIYPTVLTVIQQLCRIKQKMSKRLRGIVCVCACRGESINCEVGVARELGKGLVWGRESCPRIFL